MNKVKLAVTTYLAILGVLTINSAEAATLISDVAPDDKVNACLAKVSENADYSDAARVRHEVESRVYLSNKHKLIIGTQILGAADDQVIREYATICIAPNGDRPVTARTRQRH